MTIGTFADAINYAINNGGATVGIDGEILSYGLGYQVSLDGYEETIGAGMPFTVLCDTVAQFAEYVAHEVNHKNQDYAIGLWIDAGYLYLDVSEHIADKETAMTLGALRNQFAVYEWATGECLECDSYRIRSSDIDEDEALA